MRTPHRPAPDRRRCRRPIMVSGVRSAGPRPLRRKLRQHARVRIKSAADARFRGCHRAFAPSAPLAPGSSARGRRAGNPCRRGKDGDRARLAWYTLPDLHRQRRRGGAFTTRRPRPSDGVTVLGPVILTLNAGSSSLKFAAFVLALADREPQLIASGQIEGIGAAARGDVKTAAGEKNRTRVRSVGPPCRPRGRDGRDPRLAAASRI